MSRRLDGSQEDLITMARSYSNKTLKLLFGLSSQICPYPGCPNLIIETSGSQHEAVVLGEIAHIEAHSDDGPRSNPALSSTERNDYPNLVLLCGHHHALADAADSVYTTDQMREWKQTSERIARERTLQDVSAVTFAELKVVCDGIAQPNRPIASTPLIAVPPQEKMRANELGAGTAAYMAIGLIQAPLVADFLERMAGLSPAFPQQLRAGFVLEYERLQADGSTGDVLFLDLWQFATSSVTIPQASREEQWLNRSSALTVLCHLFEVCDVFEAPA